MKQTTLLFFIICALLLAESAQAIDFKIRGQWMIAFGVSDNNLTVEGRKQRREDDFAARQRLFLWLDAVASENLSGSLQLHIGPQQWGRASQGGALGADGKMVKVRQAYIDWQLPDTNLQTRMGIQYFILPNAAGGSVVFDTRVAGIVSNYKINDLIGITAFWIRPFNDNFISGSYDSKDPSGYLDNMDLFGITLPITGENFSVTPWAMYGIRGRNSGKFADYQDNDLEDGYPAVTLSPWLNGLNGNGLNVTRVGNTSKTYGSMFWAGLPVTYSGLEPWNFALDITYGFVEGMGGFDVISRNDPRTAKTASSQRQGWVIKGLVEYKMDWGVPGLFGWYATGDDGNVKNGSERLPSICPYGDFTSYLGDGNEHWGPALSYFDHALNYAGTWGIGLQLRDMSFIEDLKHTFRVAYWGGTNSPAMVKYMDQAIAWDSAFMLADGPYLTTNDGLLEFNLVNVYKMYENLTLNLELGYIGNYMDNDTWKRNYPGWGSYEKQDMWKAQLIFKYSF